MQESRKCRKRPDVGRCLSCRGVLLQLLAAVKELGAQRMATEVFANHQRTSTRGGILKSEAVERFTSTMCEHGIEHLQDIEVQLPGEALDQEIRKIPGQGSGISLQLSLPKTPLPL